MRILLYWPYKMNGSDRELTHRGTQNDSGEKPIVSVSGGGRNFNLYQCSGSHFRRKKEKKKKSANMPLCKFRGSFVCNNLIGNLHSPFTCPNLPSFQCQLYDRKLGPRSTNIKFSKLRVSCRFAFLLNFFFVG